MPYKVDYHHEIPDDLANISVNIKERIQKAIESRLLGDPINYGLPLRKSFQGHRKLRVRNYRIIYRIDGAMIIVLKSVIAKMFTRRHQAALNN